MAYSRARKLLNQALAREPGNGVAFGLLSSVEELRELQEIPHVIPLVDFVPEAERLYVVQFYARGGDVATCVTHAGAPCWLERRVASPRRARVAGVRARQRHASSRLPCP